MNKADGRLTSPNFGFNDLDKLQYLYDDNLNCTWILNADEGYYITLEIEYFEVNNNNDINDIYFYNFSNKVHDSSCLRGVTFSQSMMAQISNHHQYQNWVQISIVIKKAFQVLGLTCWFNL